MYKVKKKIMEPDIKLTNSFICIRFRLTLQSHHIKVNELKNMKILKTFMKIINDKSQVNLTNLFENSINLAIYIKLHQVN